MNTDTQLSTFSGEISGEIVKEFYAVYCKRNLLYQITYTFFAIFCIIFAIALHFAYPVNGSAETKVIAISSQIFLLIAALLLMVLGYGLPQIWWRWWWPRFKSIFGDQVSGEIYESGVHFSAFSALIPWNHFIARKFDQNIILLYSDKVSAIPVHAMMFEKSNDWTNFIELTRKKI